MILRRFSHIHDLKNIKMAPVATLVTLNSDYNRGTFGSVFIFACGGEERIFLADSFCPSPLRAQLSGL